MRHQRFARLEAMRQQPARVVAVEMRQGDDVDPLKIKTCVIGVALPDIGKSGVEQHLFACMRDQRAESPFRLPVHVGGKVLTK